MDVQDVAVHGVGMRDISMHCMGDVIHSVVITSMRLHGVGLHDVKKTCR